MIEKVLILWEKSKRKKILFLCILFMFIFIGCSNDPDSLQSDSTNADLNTPPQSATLENTTENKELSGPEDTVDSKISEKSPESSTSTAENTKETQLEDQSTKKPSKDQSSENSSKDQSTENPSKDQTSENTSKDQSTDEIPIDQPSEKTPEDTEFVRIIDYIPTIFVDLKYATEDNFTGQIIYDFSNAYLRYGTVKKLIAIQEQLVAQGYSLKIWDAFRPVEAQFKLWEVCPDPTYVANPITGYSSHSRGNTLDITLVYLDGSKVEMPTEFDDFSTLADRDYSEIDSVIASNALFLENLMKDNGFKAYQGEWWHFSDKVTYEVDKNFIPE